MSAVPVGPIVKGAIKWGSRVAKSAGVKEVGDMISGANNKSSQPEAAPAAPPAPSMVSPYQFSAQNRGMSSASSFGPAMSSFGGIEPMSTGSSGLDATHSSTGTNPVARRDPVVQSPFGVMRGTLSTADSNAFWHVNTLTPISKATIGSQFNPFGDEGGGAPFKPADQR